MLAATSSGRVDAVRVLINAGANVHAVTVHGNTCLHLACLNGHSSLVLELLNCSPSLLSLVNKKRQVGPVKLYIALIIHNGMVALISVSLFNLFLGAF